MCWNALHPGVLILIFGIMFLCAAVSAAFAAMSHFIGKGRCAEIGKRPDGVRGIEMAIQVNLDVMLAKRKMRMTELSDRVGVTMANLSILKTERPRPYAFSTLDRLCRARSTASRGTCLLFQDTDDTEEF